MEVSINTFHGFSIFTDLICRNPLRLNQFYMAEMTKYAASLTGAKGKALDPETITVGPRPLTKGENTEKPGKPVSRLDKENVSDSKSKGKDNKKGTKKAAAGLSKKEQMIADNKERKGGSEADKAFTAWAMIMKDLDGTSDDQDRYLKAVDYLNSIDSAKTVYLEGDIITYMLQSLVNWWAKYCKAGTKSEGYHVVALIWTTIRSICTTKSPLSKDIVSLVTKIASLLEITDAVAPMTAITDRKLSFTFKYSQTQSLSIDMPQRDFQLEHCGPYMDRMLDARPDPRVSSFIPDGWQRNVLDQLDANRSVFVVAPTSAGKTFISFYAMEQCLRADNDGVLVYVAPTKALVNQIAAEIQGKFLNLP
jgi:ATP-dependent RNA helicase DDX60